MSDESELEQRVRKLEMRESFNNVILGLLVIATVMQMVLTVVTMK